MPFTSCYCSLAHPWPQHLLLARQKWHQWETCAQGRMENMLHDKVIVRSNGSVRGSKQISCIVSCTCNGLCTGSSVRGNSFLKSRSHLVPLVYGLGCWASMLQVKKYSRYIAIALEPCFWLLKSREHVSVPYETSKSIHKR